MTQETALSACPLFAGLSPDDRAFALRCFDARPTRWRRGEILNRIGDPLARFGLVLEGVIQVNMTDFDGRQMMMASVGPGETYGESLCYLGVPTGITVCAATDAYVLHMSLDRLKAPPAPGEDGRCAVLRARFTAMLAQRTLAMNDRIQILSKVGIRPRLITFFSQYARRGGRCFTVPFDRSSMAVYLGVDRSALSRELSRMRREGLIRFCKNRFELLAPVEEP